MTENQIEDPAIPEIAGLPTYDDITGLGALESAWTSPMSTIPASPAAPTFTVAAEAPVETLRNIPAQGRSNARVESIKAAAKQHYADVGRDRFNTGDVAKIAGCSIGTIYRYFVDRVALMDAIHPNRDDANAAYLTLESIRYLRDMDGDPEQKWFSVLHILDKA